MKILLTRRAERNFDSIVKYISETWGKSASIAFISKVDTFFDLLEKYPQLGQIEKDDIRGFQISSQTRILYRIKTEEIIILAFFDVRHDSKKKY